MRLISKAEELGVNITVSSHVNVSRSKQIQTDEA